MGKIFFAALILTFCFNVAHASFSDTLLTGTWKGTSLCQVKNSPCHDEIAVYHVSKGDKTTTYRFVMNKMVNGKEEDMGVLDFTFNADARTLTHVDETRNAVWKFTVNDKSMEGTLYYKGELYRIIKLTRTK